MMKQRLIEYIKYLGISVREFERTAGLSKGYINSMSKGIGAEKLHHLCRVFPSLNSDWLLTGEGSMLNEEGTPTADVTKSYSTPTIPLPDLTKREDSPTAPYIQGYKDGYNDGYRAAMSLLQDFLPSQENKKQTAV